MEAVAVILFTMGATLTPGPSNTLVMTSASRFGARRSVPLLLGTCLGFPSLLFTIGLGLGFVVDQYPDFFFYLRVLGALYICYLAYKIFGIAEIGDAKASENPFGFLHGALFHWVNPKSWIVAFGAISSFSIFSDRAIVNTTVVSIIFVITALPCVGLWMLAGGTIRNHLNTKARIIWFHRIMAILLLSSLLFAFKL